MIFANNSYLDMGAFTVPLCKGSHCSTLDHLDVTTDETSRTPETAFPTFSGINFKPETIFAIHASTDKLLKLLSLSYIRPS